MDVSGFEMKTITVAFMTVWGVHLKLMNEDFDDWKEACYAWLNVSLSAKPA